MKTLLILAVMAISLTGCKDKTPSETFNEFKLKISDAASKGVQSALHKEYSKIYYEGMGCLAEAKDTSLYVRDKLDKFIGAERGSEPESVTGDIAKIACRTGLRKLLPTLLRNQLSDYPCLYKGFGVRTDSLADSVCDQIKI